MINAGVIQQETENTFVVANNPQTQRFDVAQQPDQSWASFYHFKDFALLDKELGSYFPPPSNTFMSKILCFINHHFSFPFLFALAFLQFSFICFSKAWISLEIKQKIMHKYFLTLDFRYF